MLRFFTVHPTVANLLMIFLMILGILAIPEMKRETFPSFKRVKVEVQIPYPGANPKDVEQAICLPIEDALDGINHLTELTCQATEGMATTVVEMNLKTGEVGRFINDIRTAVDGIDDLPDEAENVWVACFY